MKNSKLESYIINLIKRREEELKKLQENKDSIFLFGGEEFPVYTEKDYWNKFYSLSGKIDDLYLCLTAFDNNYNQPKPIT